MARSSGDAGCSVGEAPNLEHGSHHAACKQTPDVVCPAVVKVAPVKSDVIELVWIDRVPDFQLALCIVNGSGEGVGALLAFMPRRRAALWNASFKHQPCSSVVTGEASTPSSGESGRPNFFIRAPIWAIDSGGSWSLAL